MIEPNKKSRSLKDTEPDIDSKGHFIPFVAEEYEQARKNFERLGLPFGPPPKPTSYYNGEDFNLLHKNG